MHRVRMLAAAAMMDVATTDPSAMAASVPGQPAILHLARGGSVDGGSVDGGSVGGGYVARGGWGYRPSELGVYPYVHSCPYPYSYAYCTFPIW